MIAFVRVLGTTLLAMGLSASTATAETTIKVFRVGSSSFSYVLIEDTRAIVEASGDYKLVCDDRGDDAGYTRLDDFITQPGLFEEWCERQIPRIEAGGFDYVIIQTINWLGLTPQQQDKLCTEIIPSLVKRIRDAGADVILYDKYLPVKVDQRDPKARTWCLRYPEGYKLNYLLHIMAARYAGIDKISFGGAAVTELWQQEHFDRCDFLFCDPGHPGPMANYVSAVNLAFLLTGKDPVGSPVRDLPFEGLRATAFAKLADSDQPREREMYLANKDRIGQRHLTLRDDEARTLQETAMQSHRSWNALLTENLKSEAAFAETLQEIRRLQGEMDKFEDYGLDAGTVTALKMQFAPPAMPGELKPSAIATIRSKSSNIDYADTSIRDWGRKWLSREEKRDAQEAYSRFWQENNSKLRDDVYFQCRVLEQKAVQDGRRDDARRLGRTAGVINYVLSLPAYRILLERVDPQQQQTILSEYVVNGPAHGFSPGFGDYQNEHHMDREKLLKAWDIYIDIWSDPDLMDELKTSGFSQDVFHKADQRFSDRIKEQADRAVSSKSALPGETR